MVLKFLARHLGPRSKDVNKMLERIGQNNRQNFLKGVIPTSIRRQTELSRIGAGKKECRIQKTSPEMPEVIRRCVLENPAWYTPYTPYQSEIAQGRLESLFNFQTMITELTGLPMTNASMLDDATAAAEGMLMAYNARKGSGRGATVFWVDDCIEERIWQVLSTVAGPYSIKLHRMTVGKLDEQLGQPFGCYIQYPNNLDVLASSQDIGKWREAMTACDGNMVMGTEPLALSLINRVNDLGADIATGWTKYLGMPRTFNGPIAGYLSCRWDLQRLMPGKIVGLSQDVSGAPAYRMAVQTREQHIRRGRATSNICTSQMLPANLSAFFAIYHGAAGLQDFAREIYDPAMLLANRVTNIDYNDVSDLLEWRNSVKGCTSSLWSELETRDVSTFMQQRIFEDYRSETELMRYIRSLEERDLSLVHSMIPLGSCTMKLNSATAMSNIYSADFGEKERKELCTMLSDITGLPHVSLQPNSGSQGEYMGLMMIRERFVNDSGVTRDICLIPKSAHGTNPASARKAGFQVVEVKTTSKGYIDIEDLQQCLTKFEGRIGCIMITYPSTYGFFDENIIQICQIVKDAGGMVYLDGANMNAMAGLCDLSAYVDVMHLNLHKTFAIPHGGGGPGMGPICYNETLKPYDTIRVAGSDDANGILPITWAYLKLLGNDGVRQSTEMAIISANYMAARLSEHYKIMYTNGEGKVSHEFIIDFKPFLKHGITVNDVAKRLQDYGFHAPTMSWPVEASLMIEPTESESLDEMNRYCDALIQIRKEINEVINDVYSKGDNVLVNAPHPIDCLVGEWPHPYSREKAVYPLEYLRERKFWPSCYRVNDIFGDKNLVVARDK